MTNHDKQCPVGCPCHGCRAEAILRESQAETEARWRAERAAIAKKAEAELDVAARLAVQRGHTAINERAALVTMTAERDRLARRWEALKAWNEDKQRSLDEMAVESSRSQQHMLTGKVMAYASSRAKMTELDQGDQ